MVGPLLVALGCSGSPEGERAPVEVEAPRPEPDPADVLHALPPVVAIAAGEGTTCLAHEGGRVRCFGVQPLPATSAAAILEVSDARICLQERTGRTCYQQGRPLDEPPSPFVEVSRGAGAPCGRDPDGGVWCWADPRPTEQPELRPVPLPHAARRLVADGQRACAWLEDGSLTCWDPWQAIRRTPEPRVEATGVLEVDGTWMRTCWRTDAAVTCRTEDGAAPVDGLAPARALAVGRLHACALVVDDVWCWGDHTFGQLGPGASGDGSPVPVPAAHGAIAIAAGDDHTCALVDGEAVCWGRDDHGQLGGDR